uniref:Histone deacetylase domain-containing protein n=1 Tax=Strigamia maritima TaxID=126957 RepID=T1ILY2_STRMM
MRQEQVMTLVRRKFEPDAIVRQCGVDGLAGDPMEAFNLTPVALGNCIRYLLNWKLPILFLGGGGYNVPNAARCWTYLTSLIVGKNISNDIPDNHYFTQFGPDFTIQVSPGNRPNKNTNEDIESLLHTS